MKYILSIDQGTTSSRSILFDQNGEPAAFAQKEFRQYFPRPGWVEHDPEEIWESQLWTIREVITKSGISIKDIAAIGITNQRETTIVWNRQTGNPIHPAIVWQDRRTAGVCRALKQEGLQDTVRQKTGLVIDAYFSATKVIWLLEHVEGARALAESGDLAFGTVDSWLIYKLSGGNAHCTDHTNASRTMLYNIHGLDWDDELLDAFAIPRSMLPEVKPSSGHFAVTSEDLFGSGIPITGVGGDQQAALFGQLCHQPGMIKNTYGTGCFMLMHTGEQCVDPGQGLLATMACTIDERPQYALEGSVFVAGAAIQWLRDELEVIGHSADSEKLALSVPDNGGVYFVPAFTGLGTPYWDMYARGSIFGLTRGTSKAHIVRAALESIAFQSHDLMSTMEEVTGQPVKGLRVDGGASKNDFLMQFQSDIANIPVQRPVQTESTAMGAAYLAGIGAGIWSLAEIHQNWNVDKVFQPDMDPDTRASHLVRWKEAVERSKGWESE